MTDTEKKPKEPEIGNNRFTQAMGEAGNAGILYSVIGAIAITGLLYFGKDKVSWVETLIHKIEGGFEWIKKKMGNGSGNGNQKMADLMAAATAGLSGGYIIGHLAMFPGFRKGWQRADAEKKLLAERGEKIKSLEEKVAQQETMLAQQGQNSGALDQLVSTNWQDKVNVPEDYRARVETDKQNSAELKL